MYGTLSTVYTLLPNMSLIRENSILIKHDEKQILYLVFVNLMSGSIFHEVAYLSSIVHSLMMDTIEYFHAIV